MEKKNWPSRRDILKVGAGAGAASPFIYFISRALYRGLSRPFDLDFLEVYRLHQSEPRKSPLVPINDLEQVGTIRKDILEHFSKAAMGNEEVKKRWAEWGKGKPGVLDAKGCWRQTLFVPEDSMYASSHMDYCRAVLDFEFGECGFDSPDIVMGAPKQRPSVNGGRKMAFTVHMISEYYKVMFEVMAPGVEPFQVNTEDTIIRPYTGGFNVRINESSGGSGGGYTIRRDPFVFMATWDSPYEVLETPFSEFMHMFLGEHTDRRALKELEEKNPKDSGVRHDIYNSWLQVEEAVVHALAHDILSKFASKYGIAEATESEREKGISKEFEHDEGGFRRYMLLPAAIGMMNDCGHNKLIRMYQEDLDYVSRKLREAV